MRKEILMFNCISKKVLLKILTVIIEIIIAEGIIKIGTGKDKRERKAKPGGS
ncbi:MAG: hypothetical protein K1X86_00210 [Ignavibacteria bacterium]|nr:hypothetical protein [Ignavibacteria bacterium]